MKLRWRRSADPQKVSTRHDFVIEPFTDASLLGRGALIYRCRNCGWEFAVHGRRIVVIGADGSPMSGDEADERYATMALGPCPDSGGEQSVKLETQETVAAARRQQGVQSR